MLTAMFRRNCKSRKITIWCGFDILRLFVGKKFNRKIQQLFQIIVCSLCSSYYCYIYCLLDVRINFSGQLELWENKYANDNQVYLVMEVWCTVFVMKLLVPGVKREISIWGLRLCYIRCSIKILELYDSFCVYRVESCFCSHLWFSLISRGLESNGVRWPSWTMYYVSKQFFSWAFFRLRLLYKWRISVFCSLKQYMIQKLATKLFFCCCCDLSLQYYFWSAPCRVKHM